MSDSKQGPLSNTNDAWDSVPGALTCISVASDGSVWGVNSNHVTYRHLPDGLWEIVPGDQPLDQVSVGSADVVWGLEGGDIYRYIGSDKIWHKQTGELANISAAADGWTWGVNKEKMVLRRPPGGGWSKVPSAQPLDQVSVGSADNVWGLKNGDIYRYIDDEKGWEKIRGALVSISVAADGAVWGVNKEGKIYRYRGEQRWAPIAGPTSGQLVQISAGSVNYVWGVTDQAAGNVRRWTDPWTPTMPLSVQSSSMLTQDTMSGGPPPIDFTSPSPVALFGNPFENGRTEALVIAADTHELRHLKRTSAGWVLAPLVPGVTTTAREVVVAVAPDRIVWAFFIDGSGMLARARLSEVDGMVSWTIEPARAPSWGRLKVTYGFATPMRVPVVYAADTSTKSSVRVLQWQPAGAPPATMAPWIEGRATLRAGAVAWVGDEWLLHPVPSDKNPSTSGLLTHRMVARTSTGRPMRYTVTPAAADGGGPIDALDETVAFGIDRPLVVGPIDNLFVATSSGEHQDRPSLVWSELRVGGLQMGREVLAGDVAYPRAVAFLDAQQHIHIYGVDADGVLSVIHQTGWAYAETDLKRLLVLPTWAKATRVPGEGAAAESNVVPLPLDPDVDLLFVDAYPGERATLLLRMKSGEIALCSQDLSTGRWTNESLRLSATSGPVEVSCFRTQATVVDANGAPVPHYTVRAKASDLVQVIVAGEHHLLGPDQPVELETDGFGRLTFCTVANDLTTPRILLNAPGFADGIVLKPDAPVHAYLAGTGSLPLRDKLTGAVLEQSGVLPPGPISAAKVVEQIQNVFGVAGTQLDTLQGAGFVFQTLDPTQPAYRVLSSREELHAQTALLRSHPQYAGVLDDIRKRLGDVWAGIRSGAARVSTIAYDLAERAVTLVLKIGDALVELGQFVIKSFRDAARVTSAIFNAAGAAADRVVAWLRAAFDFNDIWDTKTAFEVDALGRFPDVVRDLLHRFPAKECKARLEEQSKPLLQGLEAMRAKLTGKSLQDLPGWTESSGRARPRDTQAKLFSTAKGTVTAGDLDSPQTNWLLDSILPHAGSLSGGPDVPALKGIWSEIQIALGKADLSFLTELENRLVKLFDPGNTDSLGRIAIDAFIDVLTWALNKVVAVVESLIDIFYKLADTALQHASQLLATPVTIQPIVALVDWIHQQTDRRIPATTLTLGGLFSLVLAFPATLGWKLAMGDAKSPLFPGGKLPREGNIARAGEMTDGQRCLMVGGFIQANYTFLDLVNDVESSFASSCAAVVLEVLMTIFIWPTPDGLFPYIDTKETPTQQFARWFNWAPGCTCALADLGFLLVTTMNDEPKLVRGLDPVGKTVLFLLGTLNEIAGVFETLNVETSPAGVAANVLSPLSPMFQLLLIARYKNPALLATKLAVNVVSDMGGGMSRMFVAMGK